ncbi:MULTISPECIES: type 4b pilus protein PilO2 [unclassified Pseudomonas]|uniref:type 4b pilus protein PilO2 n=1 Tax=unclassified Pseudomonas TaxID=196821 RepID=UPI001F5A76C8|nr:MULTISPECIES: type 4b pilus protein PilO2 [unclassified Pseudomonas]
MLALIEVPGFGQVIAGLDWLSLNGFESKRNEVRHLGFGADVAWEYVWTFKGDNREERSSVALLSKQQSRKRPVAAAPLVQTALNEDTFVVLVALTGDQNELQYWLLAVADGLPVKQLVLVGTLNEVIAALRDYLNGYSGQPHPVYTDQSEKLYELNYDLDIRQFSVSILSHSIKKRDVAKANFSRHTTLPIVPILLVAGVLTAGCVYWVVDFQAQEAARRDAALIRQKAIEQRKQELKSAVSAALSSTVPAHIAVAAYLDTTRDLKRSIEGWRLSELECAKDSCTLTFKAQAFATWAGYLKAKPEQWPAPVFDSDIEKIIQPIPVQLPSYVPREANGLPPVDQVRQALGNLAQITKNVGLTISVPASWQRVAGNAALNSPEEQWVPKAGDFTASGSAVLLEDLAQRLPDNCDVVSVTFKLSTPLTFEFKGKAYANP